MMRAGSRALTMIAAASRSLGNRDIPLLRPSFQPTLRLLGDVPQHVPAHRVKLPIGVEEADNAFRLLEKLNQPVQQDAIKAPALPSNVVPVMFVERVHERPPGGSFVSRIVLLIPRPLASRGAKGYQGQSLWLV